MTSLLRTHVQVILGGGRQYMFPLTWKDPEYSGSSGTRNDGRDLVEEWLSNKTVSFLTVRRLPPHNRVFHLHEVIDNFSLTKNTNVCLCGLQNAKYVWKKSDFDSVNPSYTDFLMGKKLHVSSL